MPARSRRRGGTLGRFAGGADIFDGLIRRIGAHHQQRLYFARGANPTELAPIELDLASARELLKVETGGNLSDGQAVRFWDAVKIIRRDHGTAPSHVLC